MEEKEIIKFGVTKTEDEAIKIVNDFLASLDSPATVEEHRRVNLENNTVNVEAAIELVLKYIMEGDLVIDNDYQVHIKLKKSINYGDKVFNKMVLKQPIGSKHRQIQALRRKIMANQGKEDLYELDLLPLVYGFPTEVVNMCQPYLLARLAPVAAIFLR